MVTRSLSNCVIVRQLFLKMDSHYVHVKTEYLIKTERKEKSVVKENVEDVKPSAEPDATETKETKASVEGEASGSKKRSNDNYTNNGKSQISSKKRHQETHPDKDDRLCTFVAKGEPCPFGECKYNHNVKEFLSKKPSDLGPVCYQYQTFGYCQNGVMCRFGSSHIDFENGKSLKRPESEGGVIARVEPSNLLKKDVQLALRRRDYDGYHKNLIAKKSSSSNESSSTNEGTASSSPSTEASAAATTTAESFVAPSTEDKPAYDLSAFPDKCVKLVDFSNKVYIAPLTTVGNLPYRRILKEFGADITCGEMAMANNLEMGQASEWALLRRHPTESVFGIQIAVNHPDVMGRIGRVLNNETSSDFVDINCGCPIDLVCNKGCGSSLMNKHNRIIDLVNTLAKNMPSRSITVKVRTGWDDKHPTTHKLVPMLQKSIQGKISALMIHGRSRLQRYSRLANWDYILQAAQAQDKSLPLIPIIGNGDILSWEDWKERQQYMAGSALNDADNGESLGLTTCAMLGRGALIKPWLPSEIKEQRMIDISASERLEMLKKFCNYGMEHWGSDQQGVNTTRKFLLEWLSFLHRYVPLGLLETTQKINQRPPHYFGRCDLETLLGSQSSAAWIKISELLLGPVPDSYNFIAKHKSNSYAPEDSVSNG